jgi:hypothetical protein
MTQKWDLLTIESLAGFAVGQQGPCLSLYQQTHRLHPENQQDPIRFCDLVKELEVSLKQKYPSGETSVLLEPFEALAQDREFWNHTLDGLAVLSGRGLFRVFRLPRPVVELALVTDSFHIKPLRRFLQSVERYQVLGLSLGKIRLFEGDRNALAEIDLAPSVPHTITEALGDELTHQTIASYGGEKDDADRFFRAIDRAVLEHHSKPSGLPLILAALPEHHHLFHQVSHNPFLVAAAIATNPDDMTIDELRQHAWEVVAPKYQARIDTLVAQFEEARSKDLGSDDLSQAAAAAADGRVETLLIEAADLNQPLIDDSLDDLCELVEQKGGRVVVVVPDQMPGRTGLAATYRY